MNKEQKTKKKRGRKKGTKIVDEVKKNTSIKMYPSIREKLVKNGCKTQYIVDDAINMHLDTRNWVLAKVLMSVNKDGKDSYFCKKTKDGEVVDMGKVNSFALIMSDILCCNKGCKK